MTKYQEYYKRMVDNNKELFEGFRNIHDAYALNPDKLQDEFNTIGAKVLEAIQEWENKLCMQSEKGGYSQFTSGLSEKFRNEVRKHFPEIDNVGLIVNSPKGPDKEFSIRKISLT